MSTSEITEIATRLRATLHSPTSLPLSPLLTLIGTFVSDVPWSDNSKELIEQLEEQLLDIYHKELNHSSRTHLEAFVFTLHALRTILPANSIISVWFDLVLRPALRDPRLPTRTVDEAKDLVLRALRDKESEKANGFRKMVLNLYLRDAPSVTSKEEAVEAASLEREEREKLRVWKDRLEAILVNFCAEQPEDAFEQISSAFSNPVFRLQLFILLSLLARQKTLPASKLAASSLLPKLLLSLLVDNSTTAFSVGITAFIMFLPSLALDAPEQLKVILPQLLAVLGRVVCWKVRTRSHFTEPLPDADDSNTAAVQRARELEREEEKRQIEREQRKFALREDLDWKTLESSFDNAAVSAPDAHRFFTFLYGLWPSNTLSFLRRPTVYLQNSQFQCPYLHGWEVVLDDDQIRSKSQVLLRGHVIHPSIIFRDATAELTDPPRQNADDIASIVGICTLLDVRNAALAWKCETSSPDPPPQSPSISPSTERSPTVVEPPRSLPPPRPQISIQGMISTHIALKTGLDVEIVDSVPSPLNAFPLFSASVLSEQSAPINIGQPIASSSGSRASAVPLRNARPAQEHVEEAISNLQRDVLLLMNELNFELFLRQQHLSHIGRLHRDHIVARGEEAERQHLRDKMRDYRIQLARLQDELRANKSASSDAINRNRKWVEDLDVRLKRAKEETKRREAEAVDLKGENAELKATISAQRELLADAQSKIFELETRIKENAPKVARIADFEVRFEQLTKTQALWEKDMKRYEAQEEQIAIMMSNWKKMELLLASHEHANKTLEETAKNQQLRIDRLESQLSARTTRAKSQSGPNAVLSQRQIEAMHALHERLAKLDKEYANLRSQNATLRDEVEEWKAMATLLRARTETGGDLIIPPPSGTSSTNFFRRSPVLSNIALADLADASNDNLPI